MIYFLPMNEARSRFMPESIETRMKLAREWGRQAKTIQNTFGIPARSLPSFPLLPDGFDSERWYPVLVIPSTRDHTFAEVLSHANIHSNIKPSRETVHDLPYAVYVGLEGYEELHSDLPTRDATPDELAAFVFHKREIINQGQHIFLGNSSEGSMPHYYKDTKTEGNLKLGVFKRYTSDDRTMRVLEVAEKNSRAERVLQRGIQVVLSMSTRKSHAPLTQP